MSILTVLQAVGIVLIVLIGVLLSTILVYLIVHFVKSMFGNTRK